MEDRTPERDYGWEDPFEEPTPHPWDDQVQPADMASTIPEPLPKNSGSKKAPPGRRVPLAAGVPSAVPMPRLFDEAA